MVVYVEIDGYKAAVAGGAPGGDSTTPSQGEEEADPADHGSSS